MARQGPAAANRHENPGAQVSPERQTTLSPAHGCRREGREGKREEGNVIGLNGTVNLPTCDLQAAKVGAKSDVPQLFLAIFRSLLLCYPCICLHLFVPSASARWDRASHHSTLSAQRPTTTRFEGAPGPRPQDYWPCRASLVGTVDCRCRGRNHVSPRLFFPPLRYCVCMSSRLGFTWWW